MTAAIGQPAKTETKLIRVTEPDHARLTILAGEIANRTDETVSFGKVVKMLLDEHEKRKPLQVPWTEPK
jgi:hypothetical protein